MNRLTLIFVWLVLGAVSGTPATLTCANTTLSEVQSKVNSAASGDTVVVPAGSSTWTSSLNISGKALILQGNGIGSTNITDGTSSGAVDITCSSTNFVRVTGFTFISSGSHTNDGIVNVGGTVGVGFRVDHNRFLISSNVTRGMTAYIAYGLIDNNAFDITATGGSIQSISPFGSSPGSDGGYTPWTLPLTLGTTNAVVIEANTFTYTTSIAGTEDGIDAYAGARLVIRNNTFTNVTVGFHGTDSGDMRSPHSFEIYNNSFINNSGTTLRGGTIRGGTGVIYGNTYGGSGAGWYTITLMYYRACPGMNQSGGWGDCDGTLWKLNSANLSAQGSRQCSTTGTVGFNTVDKETLGTFGGAYQRYFDGPAANGYPGRDQPGVTTGQVVNPIYIWSNGLTAGTYDGGFPPPGGIEAWVQSGRDYINNGSTPKPGYTALAYPHPLAGSAPVYNWSVQNLRVITLTVDPTP